MQKTSYIPCPIDECRSRLVNAGISYSAVGNDVYRYNSVSKGASDFSFYATVTLTASGSDGTEVTVELTPDAGTSEPLDVNDIYSQFFTSYFKALSRPAQFANADGAGNDAFSKDGMNGTSESGPFDGFGGSSSQNNSSYNPRTKYCKRCGAVIDERAAICPKCGCSQYGDIFEKRTSLVGVLAIVFAVLGGWIGLVLAIFGMLIYYKGEDPDCLKGRKYCEIAIGIFIGWIALVVLIFLINMIGMMAAAAAM